jgi:hypothetical protein
MLLDKYLPALDRIRSLCYQQGTILDLVDAPSVEFSPGSFGNGCFFQEGNIIQVAIQAPNWFLILIHEFSHSRQWIENCPAWQVYDSFEGEDYIQAWIEGDYMPPGFIDKVITATRDMELDCERRSYQLLLESGVATHEECATYIQKAMAYVLFYEHIRKYRMWYTIGNEPYNNLNIWIKAPCTLFPKSFEEEYQRMEPLFLENITETKRAA